MLAVVRIGPWALPRVVGVGGAEVPPLGGAVALRIAETRLSTARDAAAAGRPEAWDGYRGVATCERSLAHLRREAGELCFELDCPQCRAGHLRSLPDLLADVRGATVGRVVLHRRQRP